MEGYKGVWVKNVEQDFEPFSFAMLDIKCYENGLEFYSNIVYVPQNSLPDAPISFLVAIYNRRPFITIEAFGGIWSLPFIILIMMCLDGHLPHFLDHNEQKWSDQPG